VDAVRSPIRIGLLSVARRRRRRGRPTLRGFSLVELLIAASLASALLAASWGWVWTTASAARVTDARAQGATAQAFAARMLRADLARCVGLGTPDVGICGPTKLTLTLRDPDSGVDEVVTIAWDPGRGVVWRKAAGSYLAEGVTAFAVRYFAGDGSEVVPVDGVLGLEARRRVRRVAVDWTSGPRHMLVAEDVP
jgi:prepilin-type N-terminal cleavage/methylation domain-containing protein